MGMVQRYLPSKGVHWTEPSSSYSSRDVLNFLGMNHHGFCSSSSAVAYLITCIYVNHFAEGSSSDKRLATGL